MKIALIGYGKMGQTIERIATDRGHKITCIIDVNNIADFESNMFKEADVAIEFSTPNAALGNILRAFAVGLPVVCGTTGWNQHLPALKQEIEANGHALFWSSNYSVGVSIFRAVNQYLAKLMNQFSYYNVNITEVHHTQKLDAPSGTAITLAEEIIANLERKKQWSKVSESEPGDLAIKSIRKDEVPGIHTVMYSSEIDNITIEHKANNRYGFALGAVMAAEFLVGKKGFYTMQDMLKL
ncbi:MAG TPA: 4-hydroxy-tetrahydrodipicolinate reductase [Paludibacter sp.]|nr:4-hydroxy-tetrahydrodipicolinate reductase [Paludibacter sp.]HOS45342.1 4-hydroxy-tetrahydrodipicolinate reductase [Paludibacter sp.]HPM10328.1 4-hydroxy-tetrahydrodipicolinate reductase [Paludibacter sp.]